MNVMGFYQEYVHALVEPLFYMTYRGVRFDTTKRKDVREEYETSFNAMQARLNELVGHELNIGSHKQMTTWLYNELKLPKQTKKRKDTGDETETAGEEALRNLYKKFPREEIKLVLEMREKQKLLSTYLNVKIDEDKRIRCSYNIAGTETGRLSSSSTAFGTGTNLQNIPDGIIRSMFIPDEGYIFINADLSQAEARVVAYLSRDQRLIEVFEQGGDIHRKNAANIYNCKEEEVTNEQRNLAKRVVHASNYGMGPRTFAQTAGITEAEATKLLNRYFATYPRIKLWHMQIKDQLNKTRMLTTPLGRRRIFFNRWNDSLFKEGLAFIPQSTVADLVNASLVDLHIRWKCNSLGESKHLLLQVHDSILAQAKEDRLDEAVKEIKEAMTRPIEINGKFMVIPVDVKVGKDWHNLKKVT